jgi:Carboxylesterase family
MMLSVLVILTAAVCTRASSIERLLERQSNWTVGQTVQTSSGPVSGHPAADDSQVSEYLGIPYGQAPIGDLRFAAPVKFIGNASLNGTSFVSLHINGHIFLLMRPHRAFHVQFNRALALSLVPPKSLPQM